MIKAIIFDLDMCILNTHSLEGPFFQPVLDTLYNSDLPRELKKIVEYELWSTSLEDVVKKFDLPHALAEKLRTAYRIIEVPDGIKTFGDESYIRDLAVKKILVTSGYKKFQQTKIDKLGIAELFDEVIIDSLDDPALRRGKNLIFEEVAHKYGLNHDEVLVVGDNPISELGVGKALGMPTAQTLRPTIEKWEDADHHINNFSQLANIIK